MRDTMSFKFAPSMAQIEGGGAMNVTREQLARAIDFWGKRVGADDHNAERITLPKEASLLVDVLAEMDFYRQPLAAVEDGSERARLITEAIGRT
ncbi:hypothetical protein DBR42_00905 [Pelomonas sp. HMWF004]|nr:hypothetical protein DBR42_00905 [Pelomonas sp. HMWF004]